MIAHQLNQDNIIINTIVVDSLDFLPNLIDASIGGSIGDTVLNGQVIPKSIKIMVPDVTGFQLRLALNAKGLRTLVETVVQQGTQDIKDGWEYASIFTRQHPLILALEPALGLTSDQIDAVFILASTFNNG